MTAGVGSRSSNGARPVGVVLAAGRGVRMGGPKAEMVVDGERLMDRAVRLLVEAGCDPVAVIGRSTFSYPDVLVWWPEDPEAGLRASLEVAFHPDRGFLDEEHPVAVMLVDQPGLTVEGTRAVIEAWRPGRISIGTIGGRRVHPVVMEPALWRAAIAMADPDEGARRYLATHAEEIDETEVPGDAIDLDTPADLTDWRNRATPSAS